MKSFCPSKKKCNLGGQLGDKFGEKRQIWTLKNKNLQIWALFIVLEIKQIMSNICRWYVFLCKNHFPMQKVLYFNNLFYINDLYMYMCLSRDKLGTKIGVKNAKKNKYRH